MPASPTLPLWKTTRPRSSTASSSTHTSKASTVPPGKKWPTFRVRTTTSIRTDSPRRTVAPTRSSGATTSAGGERNAWGEPKLIDSSPCANVLASRASPGPAAFASAGAAPSAVRTRPKTSTDTWPSRRKAWVTRSCSGSWLTKGRAVFAAGKRWEWTWPSRAAGSCAATSGMWQSAHFWGFAG